MIILRNKLRFIAVFSLMFVFLAGAVAAQPKTGKSVLDGIEKSIDAGKTAEVEKGLFDYVIANPKDARGFFVMAKLRTKQNRLQEAKSLLSKALSIDSALLPAKLAAARVHFQLGETERATEIVNGIADAEVIDPSSRFALAETAAMVGDCPKALSIAEKMPPAIKNGKALPLRANCYLRGGDSKNLAALTVLAKGIVRREPAVAGEFAAVLSKASMHRETADLLRLVIAAAPNDLDALLLLARSEILLKDFAKAKLRVTAAERIRPKSAEVFFVSALLESEQGNHAAALDLLEKSLSEKVDDPEVLARYVVVGLRAGQNGKAIRAAERLISLQPDSLDNLYLLGIASLQSNNLAKAETALTRFVEARPSDSLGCLALGLTFAAQPEKIEIARGQLQKCLTVNPNNFEAAYQLGLSYKVQGETVRAIEFLERTIKIAPEYAPALRDLGTVYLQSGGEAKARPVLEKAAALDPKDPETHFQLSRLYNLIGERELAARELELFQKLRNPKKEGME